jgi:hypothetical protein
MGNISQIVKTVYNEYISYFGEPDLSTRFGGNEPEKEESHLPGIIDVFVWLADEEVDITTFATIGMSDKPMKGTNFRAELHFSIRGTLTENEISTVSVFMANVAVYPFIQDVYFDWLQLLSNPGEIPCFDKATSLLFHPAFVENGWDKINTDEQDVKILNLVPITEDERILMKQEGFGALARHFEQSNIDLFERR